MAKQGNTINVARPIRGAVLPQRDGEVRQAREEGRDRAAVTLLRFRPRVLFLSARPGARAGAARRRVDHAPRPAAAARRRLHRRDHAAAGDGATSTPRWAAIRTLASRRAARVPIGRDALRARLRRGGRGQALRQGLARASTASWRSSSAGIRLVIAESFERIYRQNADNVGLYTSTDIGLVERIERGEAIDARRAARRAATRSPRAIVRRGGLLRVRPTTLLPRMRAAPTPPTIARGRCSRRSSRVTRWPPPTAVRSHARRRRLRAHGLALHPRVLHRHVRAPARQHVRRRARDSRPTVDRHLRRPPSYMDRSPAHMRQGLVANVRAMSQRAPRVRRAARPARPWLPADA